MASCLMTGGGAVTWAGREFNSFGKSSVVLYGKHINIVVWIVSVESGHVVTSFDPASSLA